MKHHEVQDDEYTDDSKVYEMSSLGIFLTRLRAGFDGFGQDNRPKDQMPLIIHSSRTGRINMLPPRREVYSFVRLSFLVGSRARNLLRCRRDVWRASVVYACQDFFRENVVCRPLMTKLSRKHEERFNGKVRLGKANQRGADHWTYASSYRSMPYLPDGMWFSAVKSFRDNPTQSTLILRKGEVHRARTLRDG
jgi:hypothetical protein